SQGVWDSNFVGVYHCQEASGNLLDSTAYGNTLSQSGGVGTASGAPTGSARTFNGSDQFANVASPNLATCTLESWINFAAVGSYNYGIISNMNSGFTNGQIWFQVQAGYTQTGIANNSNYSVFGYSQLAGSAWEQFAFTSDGTGASAG